MNAKNQLISVFIFVVTISLVILFYFNKSIITSKLGIKKVNHNPNIEFILQTETKVIVTANPSFKYSFDTMKKGVIQHIDRNYTYDYIPKELENGLLFQGIHRPSIGTSIKIELFQSAIVYFFFHDYVDGGYSDIFSNLKEWEKCNDTPQYDIHNGDHGLKMKMYKMKAEKGVYLIPSTTKERACFNIVFKLL